MGVSIVVNHVLVFSRSGPRAKVTAPCCIKRSAERPDFCAEHLVIKNNNIEAGIFFDSLDPHGGKQKQ